MGMLPFMSSAGFFSNVIPAKAGIQGCDIRRSFLDSRFRGNDEQGIASESGGITPAPESLNVEPQDWRL
jgi:hypothetical protein